MIGFLVTVIIFAVVGYSFFCAVFPEKELPAKVTQKEAAAFVEVIADDNFKFVSEDDDITYKGEDAIEYIFESEYGFEFTVIGGVISETPSGGCSSIYLRQFWTDYTNQLVKHEEKNLKAIFKNYGQYLENDEAIYAPNIVHTESYSVYSAEGKCINFTIKKYDDLVDANEFAYEIATLFSKYKVDLNALYFNLDTGVGSFYANKVIFDLNEVLLNKEQHLKELQQFYIYLVQNGGDLKELESFEHKKSSIKTVRVKHPEHYFDKIVDDIEVYYLPEIDEYGVVFEDRLSSDILEYLAESGDDISFEGNTLKYRVGGNNYVLTSADEYDASLEEMNESLYFTKNGEEYGIRLYERPIYYGGGNYTYFMRLDDFAYAIGCDYELIGEELNFYLK